MKLEKVTWKGGEYIFRQPENGIFYFRRYTKRTGEVYKSLKTTEPEEAKKRRDEILGCAQKQKVNMRLAPTVLELFDKWVARKETLGAANNTLVSINASRKHFEPYFAYMLPHQITAEWWESEYIPSIKQRSKNPNRKFFNDRKWLIAFLRQIRDDGALAALPTIRKIDKPTKVGKVYSGDELETLLNFAQNEDLLLAILMAATMGMRRGEIFALSCERIDTVKKVIHLRADDTKTRRARSFAISKHCWPMIQRRCLNGAKWLFPNRFDKSTHLHLDGFKTAWTNLKRTTKIKGRFHDLRHTFLTNAFKTPNINPALICYYAGLSMEVAERVYLHFTADDTLVMDNILSIPGDAFGETP